MGLWKASHLTSSSLLFSVVTHLSISSLHLLPLVNLPSPNSLEGLHDQQTHSRFHKLSSSQNTCPPIFALKENLVPLAKDNVLPLVFSGGTSSTPNSSGGRGLTSLLLKPQYFLPAWLSGPHTCSLLASPDSETLLIHCRLWCQVMGQCCSPPPVGITSASTPMIRPGS